MIGKIRERAAVGGSDHSTVNFDLNLAVLLDIVWWKLDFKCADYHAIQEHLMNVDWIGSFNGVRTVNEMYELFLAVLRHTIEMFVPLRKVKTAHLSLPEYLRKKMSYRFRIWKQAVLKNDPISWSKYKDVNFKTGKAINKYQAHLEKKLVESNDHTKFFRYIKLRVNRKGSIPSLVGEQGETVVCDANKADLLAKVFQNAYNRPHPDDPHTHET